MSCETSSRGCALCVVHADINSYCIYTVEVTQDPTEHSDQNFLCQMLADHRSHVDMQHVRQHARPDSRSGAAKISALAHTLYSVSSTRGAGLTMPMGASKHRFENHPVLASIAR